MTNEELTRLQALADAAAKEAYVWQRWVLYTESLTAVPELIAEVRRLRKVQERHHELTQAITDDLAEMREMHERNDLTREGIHAMHKFANLEELF